MAATKKAGAGKDAGAEARTGATKAEGAAGVKAKAKSKATRTEAEPAAAPAPKAAPKAAAPVKLNDRQREFLGRIKLAGEGGYEVGPKVEQRTIDALIERKLVKRGAKNKESGQPRYLLTKAAAKHLPAPPPAAAPAPAAPVVEPAPAVAPDALG